MTTAASVLANTSTFFNTHLRYAKVFSEDYPDQDGIFQASRKTSLDAKRHLYVRRATTVLEIVREDEPDDSELELWLTDLSGVPRSLLNLKREPGGSIIATLGPGSALTDADSIPQELLDTISSLLK